MPWNIPLFRSSNKNLFFLRSSSYQVIVLKVADGVEKLPDDYAQRLNGASPEKLNFYIAAEIENDPVYNASWEFIVGNEQENEKFINKKLDKGEEYMVYQRAISRDNSVSRSSYKQASHDTFDTPNTPNT